MFAVIIVVTDENKKQTYHQSKYPSIKRIPVLEDIKVYSYHEIFYNNS